MNILEVKNLTKIRSGFCLNQVSLELAVWAACWKISSDIYGRTDI